MYIAIDTSTETASLALVGDGGLIAEFTWSCGQNHSVQLLPNLVYMLHQAKTDLSAAKGVIVARGPGGYNGLRVGLSTAKGLAYSLNIPIAGISTLEVLAYQYAGWGLPVCPVLSTGGSETAAAIYELKEGKWTRLMAEEIVTVALLCSRISTRTVFCGQISPPFAAGLIETLGDNAVILPAAAGWRRAGFLAELGLKRLRNNDCDEPVSLQPLYLKGPSITQAKHR